MCSCTPFPRVVLQHMSSKGDLLVPKRWTVIKYKFSIITVQLGVLRLKMWPGHLLTCWKYINASGQVWLKWPMQRASQEVSIATASFWKCKWVSLKLLNQCRSKRVTTAKHNVIFFCWKPIVRVLFPSISQSLTLPVFTSSYWLSFTSFLTTTSSLLLHLQSHYFLLSLCRRLHHCTCFVLFFTLCY